jgi:intracellular multiplication protein IcmO
VTLPLRLPPASGTGTIRRRLAGVPAWRPAPIYLGHDLKGRELWISSEDGRQHATVPGTTGAGKTTALLSFLANALAQASGFVLVDGKADNKLYGEVLALARRFGREDRCSLSNFMVASGVEDSNRLCCKLRCLADFPYD